MIVNCTPCVICCASLKVICLASSARINKVYMNDMEFRKHRNEVNPNDKEVNSYSSAKTYPIPILV